VFTSDGRSLIIWETSRIHHEERPIGWRGDVIMADTATGNVLWERSIDADTTGPRPSLKEIGEPMGYATTPCVTSDGEFLALGLDGAVVLLAIGDGQTHAVLQAEGKTNAVCASQTDSTLALATSHGLRRIRPTG
jgi:hypothetical protein